jgi:hypothetical protein
MVTFTLGHTMRAGSLGKRVVPLLTPKYQHRVKYSEGPHNSSVGYLCSETRLFEKYFFSTCYMPGPN